MRELSGLLFSYLKTYLISAGIFAVFFVFYAGIKTNRISIELMASIFAALVGSILAWVIFVFLKEEIRAGVRVVIGELMNTLLGKKKAADARAVRTEEIAQLVRVFYSVSSVTILVVVRMIITNAVFGVPRLRQIEDAGKETEGQGTNPESLVLPSKSRKTVDRSHIAH